MDQLIVDEIYNRLAELEDRIKNGTLIELPCTVWLIDYCRGEIYPQVAYTYTLIHWSVSGAFGEWVFFTKAEAEDRLKELKELKGEV